MQSLSFGLLGLWVIWKRRSIPSLMIPVLGWMAVKYLIYYPRFLFLTFHFCTFENLAFSDWYDWQFHQDFAFNRWPISAGGRESWRRTGWAWRWSLRLGTTHTRSFSLHGHWSSHWIIIITGNQALKLFQLVAKVHPEGPSFLFTHPAPHYRLL